jgi:hypothetical protein
MAFRPAVYEDPGRAWPSHSGTARRAISQTIAGLDSLGEVYFAGLRVGHR